jgi:hypothetical protein
MYPRKRNVTRSNSPQEGMAVFAAGKVTARIASGGLTNVLAGAITAIPPKAPSVNKFTKMYQMNPHVPTSITGGKGKSG